MIKYNYIGWLADPGERPFPSGSEWDQLANPDNIGLKYCVLYFLRTIFIKGKIMGIMDNV
jgi:hypothetical protein